MNYCRLFILFACICMQGYGKKPAAVPHHYFISNTGDDHNNGLSSKTAWRSLQKLNEQTLQPGDKVLLKGGEEFEGTIVLNSLDNGTGTSPITISSYGTGDAVINAGNSAGLKADNVSHIRLTHLHFKGAGVDANQASGIHFYTDKTVSACRDITIDSCIAEGFHDCGIYFSCAEIKNVKGYQQVRITHCIATANGEAGISSVGEQTGYHHTDFYIGYCKAYLNKGIVSKTENHSGNGIVMGGVEHILIEHCEAFENGELNRCTAGGPVGIWLWLCKDGVIQYCESHHNHAGLTKDGGGFDIDGGAANCILQYNYSHDNEGAGYLLAEYGAVLPFTHNTIRFNISQNDGRKNNYGGISIWGVDSTYKVTESYVYNNTIYVNDQRLVNGTPSAVLLMDNHFSGVLVANNIFISSGNALLVSGNAETDSSVIQFLGNRYYAESNRYNFVYNVNPLHSIKDWQQITNSHERSAKNILDNTGNPELVAQGTGTTIADTKNIPFLLGGYQRKSAAGLLHTAIDLQKKFNIHPGQHDFFKRTITAKTIPFVGAAL